MPSKRIIAFNVCFFLMILTGTLLLSFSFHIVDKNHIAIYQNTYSKKINTQLLYRPGRYFTGLLGTFIQFDVTWKQLHFTDDAGGNAPAVRIKTSDSADLVAHVSVVYRIKPEFVVNIYENYPQDGSQLESMLAVVQAGIAAQASKFAYSDFFASRDAVQDAMSQEIARTLRNNYYCEMTLFALRDVAPQSEQLQRAVVQTVVTAVEQTAEASDAAAASQTAAAQITATQLQYAAQVDRITQAARTKAAATVADATAQYASTATLQQANGFKDFRSVLGWTQADVLQFFALYSKLQYSARARL